MNVLFVQFLSFLGLRMAHTYLYPMYKHLYINVSQFS